MKFNLRNPEVIFNRLMLQDSAIVEQIAATEQWTKGQVFEAEVKINGVVMPAEIFEEWMQKQYKSMEESFKERYDVFNFDNRVEERAKELLKEQAEGCLEVMYNLQQKLEEADSMLKMSWER